MALSPTEESLVRQLIAQNPALLNLASSESTIISKLGATKVSLSGLSAATSLSDADLALVRQGLNDKSFAMSVLRDYVSANLPTASTTTKGIVELATNTETQTGTDAVRAVTPAGLASVTATETRAGIVELATNAETQTGTDAVRAVTPAGLASVTATETRAGLLEIATTAEAQALTDDVRAITAKKLADAFGLRVGHTFTGNDWAPLGGGLIIQWGTVVAPTTSSVSVTFPLAFPNNVFSLAGAPKSAGSSWDGFEYDALTNTGFAMAHIFNGAQSAGTTTWIAIGN